MCKLFIATNTKFFKRYEAEKLTKAVSSMMVETEQDGFGILARNHRGQVFSRRFTDPKSASLINPFPVSKLSKTGFDQFGELNRPNCLIFHGRTSTNALGLNNTHPIARNGTHLCHNGVVQDFGPKYEMNTGNDTEHVAERFSQGISEVEKHLAGFYAFAALNESDNLLHIVRDSIAPLYFAEVLEKDCTIFATTPELIDLIRTELGFKISVISELRDNVHLIYDGNVLKAENSITPRGRSVYADSKAYLSLGKTLDSGFGTFESQWGEKNYLPWTSESNFSSEDRFLVEVETEADHSWSFFSENTEIYYDEFLQMSDLEKLSCLVIRSDGTVCSPDPVENGKLFGKVGT